MTINATTSPFTAITESDPWILWCVKTPVSTLNAQEQTDGRSVFDEKEENRTDNLSQTPIQAISEPIQHNRYNSVLARINHASQKTGSYSAWKN